MNGALLRSHQLTQSLADEIGELESPTKSAQNAEDALLEWAGDTQQYIERLRQSFERDLALLPDQPTRQDNAQVLADLELGVVRTYSHLSGAVDDLLVGFPDLRDSFADSRACQVAMTS